MANNPNRQINIQDPFEVFEFTEPHGQYGWGRGEVVERTFARLCETGGGRRTWLRGLTKVTKRYQVLALSHNLGLILRKLCGAAKPRAFTLALSLGTLRLAALRTLKPTSHPQPVFLKFEITFSQTALAT